MFLVFEIIAVWLWLSTGNLFFLLNFSYLGVSIGGGAALLAAGWKYGRELTQFLVGSYMLVFLGLICRENMQIEGFWFYLASGIFTGATLHYLIAKIFGPLLFGRGWCGYACWTAMILDLLPYKTPKGPAGLANARDLARVGQLPEADAAHAVLAQHGVGTAADAAAGICAGRELCGPRLLNLHACLSHVEFPPSIRPGTACPAGAAVPWLPRRSWRW